MSQQDLEQEDANIEQQTMDEQKKMDQILQQKLQDFQEKTLKLADLDENKKQVVKDFALVLLQDHYIDRRKLKQDLKQKYNRDLDARIQTICIEDKMLIEKQKSEIKIIKEKIVEQQRQIEDLRHKINIQKSTWEQDKDNNKIYYEKQFNKIKEDTSNEIKEKEQEFKETLQSQIDSEKQKLDQKNSEIQTLKQNAIAQRERFQKEFEDEKEKKNKIIKQKEEVIKSLTQEKQSLENKLLVLNQKYQHLEKQKWKLESDFNKLRSEFHDTKKDFIEKQEKLNSELIKTEANLKDTEIVCKEQARQITSLNKELQSQKNLLQQKMVEFDKELKSQKDFYELKIASMEFQDVDKIKQIHLEHEEFTLVMKEAMDQLVQKYEKELRLRDEKYNEMLKVFQSRKLRKEDREYIDMLKMKVHELVAHIQNQQMEFQNQQKLSNLLNFQQQPNGQASNGHNTIDIQNNNYKTASNQNNNNGQTANLNNFNIGINKNINNNNNNNINNLIQRQSSPQNKNNLKNTNAQKLIKQQKLKQHCPQQSKHVYRTTQNTKFATQYISHNGNPNEEQDNISQIMMNNNANIAVEEDKNSKSPSKPRDFMTYQKQKKIKSNYTFEQYVQSIQQKQIQNGYHNGNKVASQAQVQRKDISLVGQPAIKSQQNMQYQLEISQQQALNKIIHQKKSSQRNLLQQHKSRSSSPLQNVLIQQKRIQDLSSSNNLNINSPQIKKHHKRNHTETDIEKQQQQNFEQEPPQNMMINKNNFNSSENNVRPKQMYNSPLKMNRQLFQQTQFEQFNMQDKKNHFKLTRKYKQNSSNDFTAKQNHNLTAHEFIDDKIMHNMSKSIHESSQYQQQQQFPNIKHQKKDMLDALKIKKPQQAIKNNVTQVQENRPGSDQNTRNHKRSLTAHISSTEN